MTYQRPPGSSQADLQASKEYEQHVRQHLPDAIIDQTSSTDKLDFWHPGWVADIKEKRQPLTNRWRVLPDVPEQDLFVLDELSLRKALVHGMKSYFIIRDVPCGRVFLAAAWEVACSDKVRRQRGGKGKIILDLTNFRQVHFLNNIPDLIQADLLEQRWKKSECISEKEVPQV